MQSIYQKSNFYYFLITVVLILSCEIKYHSNNTETKKAIKKGYHKSCFKLNYDDFGSNRNRFAEKKLKFSIIEDTSVYEKIQIEEYFKIHHYRIKNLEAINIHKKSSITELISIKGKVYEISSIIPTKLAVASYEVRNLWQYKTSHNDYLIFLFYNYPKTVNFIWLVYDLKLNKFIVCLFDNTYLLYFKSPFPFNFSDFDKDGQLDYLERNYWKDTLRVKHVTSEGLVESSYYLLCCCDKKLVKVRQDKPYLCDSVNFSKSNWFFDLREK